jgi:hypothetical protein
MFTLRYLFLICYFAFLTANGFAQNWQTVVNGEHWEDTDGKRIQAHGGGFIKVEDTYYWFGEDKSHNSHLFKAVNCYASRDLANWTFKNAVLIPTTHPDLAISGRVIERPKVLYNEQTGQFVMWLHWESSNYGAAECGIAKSATIDGDYELVAHFRPNNNMSRDCTLFKDDDGTAYFVSAANENADLIIYRLTGDYLDIQEQVITLWRGAYREAPALLKTGGIYYLFSSGATGWDPNQAKYATATAMTGPWSALTNIGDNITFDSQSTYIIPVTGTDTTTHIFCGDRWQDPDLQGSKYIWLPLHIEDGKATLSWLQIWQINTSNGAWGLGFGELPAAPANLRVTKSTATRIGLAWDDLSENEAGFEVQRQYGGSVQTVFIGRNKTTHEAIALLPGKTYVFRVRAVNGAGYSEYTPDLNATTASDISDSLILNFRFESGSGRLAVDSSAYQNNGNLVNGVKWVEGYSGGGLEFNGVSAYIDLGENEYFDLQTGITVAAWVKQYDAANSEHNPWITKGDHTFGLKHYSGNSYQFFIYNNGWYSASTPSSFQDNNKWMYFAGTYDGKVVRIYVNGEPKAQRAHSGSIDLGSAYHVNLGRNSEHTDRLFHGVLDDVKIFNVALTAEEVVLLYSDAITRVNELANDTQSWQFTLYQNYPNPFNANTRITYRLAEQGKINLSIYNLLKQKLVTLVDKMQNAGVHSVDFQGADLSSGIYIAALKTGTRGVYKKITVLK